MIEALIEGGEVTLRELSPEEIADVLGPIEDLKDLERAEVNAERDRRIDGGFAFAVEGVTYVVQSRQTDRENIEALARDADKAIAAGALAGDFAWNDRYPAPFGFIMADNQIVPIDAHQMVAMREAGAAFKANLTFFARSLKAEIDAAPDHATARAVRQGATWPS